MIQGGGLVTGRSAPMLGCRIRVAVFGDYCLCDARCAGVERRGRGRRGARQTATRAVAMIGVPGGPPERTFAGGLWSAAPEDDRACGVAGRGVHVQTANAAGSIVFWSR